jgi:hypothetical protein
LSFGISLSRSLHARHFIRPPLGFRLRLLPLELPHQRRRKSRPLGLGRPFQPGRHYSKHNPHQKGGAYHDSLHGYFPFKEKGCYFSPPIHSSNHLRQDPQSGAYDIDA